MEEFDRLEDLLEAQSEENEKAKERTIVDYDSDWSEIEDLMEGVDDDM